MVNKLPVFLQTYAPMMYEPFTIEHCIKTALDRVDPAIFPSFDQLYDVSNRTSVLPEARQDFLFACALHQLMPEGNIEELLGDVPMQSLPESGRYDKSNIVTHCTANPGKIEAFIGELENMEGNAGEIAGALIEVCRPLPVLGKVSTQ